MIEFFIPSEPQGKQSPRAVKIGGFARVIKDPKTRRYEDLVAMFASQAMAGQPPIDVPVTIAVRAIFGVPASWSARKQRDALAGLVLPTRRPDCSNVLKAIEDGCNAIVYRDDALIVDAGVSKAYGAAPGVHVRIWPAIPVCKLLGDVAQAEEMRPGRLVRESVLGAA